MSGRPIADAHRGQANFGSCDSKIRLIFLKHDFTLHMSVIGGQLAITSEKNRRKNSGVLDSKLNDIYNGPVKDLSPN